MIFAFSVWNCKKKEKKKKNKLKKTEKKNYKKKIEILTKFLYYYGY